MAGFRSGEFKSSGSDGAVLRCPSRLTSSISIRVASVVADRRGFYRLRGKKKERRKERKGERFVSELKNTTDWLHNLKWQRKGKSKLRRRPRDSIYHLFIIERSISGSFPIFIRRAPSPPNFCSQRWKCPSLPFEISLKIFQSNFETTTYTANVFVFSSSSARYFAIKFLSSTACICTRVLWRIDRVLYRYILWPRGKWLDAWCLCRLTITIT